MQERSVTPGQLCRKWLSVLLGIFTVFSCILLTAIPAPHKDKPGETAQVPASLHQWTQPDTLVPTDDLKALKQGVDLYQNESYESALDVLPVSLSVEGTTVGDYILFYRAKSYLMTERYKEALDSFQILKNGYPHTSLMREVLIGQCQGFLELNDPKSALSVLDSGKTSDNPESLFCKARALDKMGEKDRAVALYLQIYSKYPTSQSSPPAESNLLSLSPEAFKGARNYKVRMQRAENLMKAGETRSARQLLLALGRVAAPDSASAQKQSLMLADAEYRLNMTQTALSRLRTVTSAHPALHAKALYLEGAGNRRLDREKTFIALRDKALKLYPSSISTEELCYSVATYFDVKYEHARAREAYKVLHQAFPKGRRAQRALWKLSLFSYMEKDYEKAAVGFWNYLTAYTDPPSASSAMYWLGRCYEKSGRPENALYLYGRVQNLINNSYYGQRAREAQASIQKSGNIKKSPISGLDFKQVVATCGNIRLPPIQFSKPNAAGERIIERARQLVAADLPDLALAELRWGIRKYPKNDDALNYVMSNIYASKGEYNEAISCLLPIYPHYSTLPPASLPEEIWRMFFPTLYLEIISKHASGTKTDPALILGIIRQESAFEQNAQSRAGACGLMQILPSTGRKLARQARISRYNSQKLFQAETNITLGTRFLSSLLQEYGRPELALAAYNAGRSRVDRWLKEFGDADMVEFVELIPFYETRNYVQKVLSNKTHYRLLTSSSASARPKKEK